MYCNDVCMGWGWGGGGGSQLKYLKINHPFNNIIFNFKKLCRIFHIYISNIHGVQKYMKVGRRLLRDILEIIKRPSMTKVINEFKNYFIIGHL